MNSRRRIVVATLAFVSALAITLLLLPRSREPVYQGHTLSWLIHQWDAKQDTYSHKQDAERPIQQIGTNALPTLLDWIRYDEPPWRTRLINRLYAPGGAPAFLQNSTLKRLAMGPGRSHAFLAISGFAALGPAAQPAAVELVELFASKSPSTRRCAMHAILGMQGQKALILAAGLTNSESTVRLRAAKSIALCFQTLGSRSRGNDPDMDPAPAVPLLTKALDDPDINVRQAVTNTLRIIAPKTLENADTPALPLPNTASDEVTNSVHR